jgi:lipopolysaccharide transport system permease protein
VTDPGPANSDAPAALRIDSRRHRFPDLRELFEYLPLAFLLGRRDITTRYRQTVLGTVWIFAGALVTAGLFSFVFGRVAKLPSDGYPYFVFSYSGLLVWNLYSMVLSSTAGSLNTNGTLISKIYFPRLVLPLSTLASNLLNLLISFGILVVLLFVFGIGISWHMVLLPVWLLLGLMLGLGAGLILASFSGAYRDIGYMTPVLTSILLYLSPVAYSISAVPEDLRNLYLLNPIATVIEGCRWSALGRDYLPPAWAMAYSVVFAVVLLIAGMSLFAYRESHFADVI